MSERDSQSGIASLLGRFWSNIYGGRGQVATLCRGMAALAQQHLTDLRFAASLATRSTVEPYRRELWYPLILRQSQKNTSLASLPTYGEGFIYNSVIAYGQPLLETVSYPLPDSLREVAAVSNRITHPSRCWFPGVDCEIRDGAIFFDSDPFDDPLVAVTATGDDRLALLWLQDAMFEHGDLHAQHGVVFGIRAGQDSRTAKPALDVLADGVILGSSTRNFKDLLGVATGVPRAVQTEAVVTIERQASQTLIVTATAVYSLPPTVTVDLSPGDQITQDSFLSPDVDLWSFNDGPLPGWLSAILGTPGLTSRQFENRLIFENRDLPLSSTAIDDVEHVYFDLGDSQASREFLAAADAITNLHDAIAAGGTLPETINPLQFFVDNWWRDSLLVVRVAGTVPVRDNWYLLNFLRKRVPPNVLLVLLIGLPEPTDSMVIGGEETAMSDNPDTLTEPVAIPDPTSTARSGLVCE